MKITELGHYRIQQKSFIYICEDLKDTRKLTSMEKNVKYPAPSLKIFVYPYNCKY